MGDVEPPSRNFFTTLRAYKAISRATIVPILRSFHVDLDADLVADMHLPILFTLSLAPLVEGA